MPELFYVANQKRLSNLYTKLPIWYRCTDEEAAQIPQKESTITLQGEQWLVKEKPIRNCLNFSSIEHPDKVALENVTSAIPYLLDCVDQLPNTFAIYDPESIELYGVGAHKILSHEDRDYALKFAATEDTIAYPAFPDVKVEILMWLLPTLRLRSENREQVTDLAGHIIANWESYDEKNSVTALAHIMDGEHVLDLILCGKPSHEIRATSSTLFPKPFGMMGKMGFAILDNQQKEDCRKLAKMIIAHEDCSSDPELEKYAPWQQAIYDNYSVGADNISFIMDMEIRNAFAEKLMQMAVFEHTQIAFNKYMEFVKRAAD